MNFETAAEGNLRSMYEGNINYLKVKMRLSPFVLARSL